jgi:hypothetical protein
MARTKNAKNPQRTVYSTPILDPWDVEHQNSLAAHGPMASTDHIYPITVHRGFEASDTAEPLTRRYPRFEESESHREFLVRSRSERLITTGERDNYYTPEQLWEEDDRVRGTMQFARNGEPSWVDEEEDSSDEEEEAEGPTIQRNAVVQQQAEVEVDVELPLTLRAEDRVTTVAAVAQDHRNVEDFVTSVNLSTTASLLAITVTFLDGTVAVALCGHGKTHETTFNRWDSQSSPKLFIRENLPKKLDLQTETTMRNSSLATSLGQRIVARLSFYPCSTVVAASPRTIGRSRLDDEQGEGGSMYLRAEHGAIAGGGSTRKGSGQSVRRISFTLAVSSASDNTSGLGEMEPEACSSTLLPLYLST